jgi:hypothetical protein
MNKFKSCLFSAIFCMALLLITASINVGQAEGAQGPQNVNVINTPLPVQVVNPVTNPALQPFQATGGSLLSEGQSSLSFVLVTVPAGKRLVIEHATASGFFGEGNKMIAGIYTTVGGVEVFHNLVMTEQGTINDPVTFTAAQPMRVYADPGTNVIGITQRTPLTGGGGMGITISGYFVDIPLP